MRNFMLLLFLFVNLPYLIGQKSSKVDISTSGCTVEVFCFPGRFDVYELADESTVYANDCEKEGVMYGIFCVKLKHSISDLKLAEDTVIAYLDFLKLDYGIVKSRGYKKGFRLNKDANTRGIFDSWEDVEKKKWEIKAWTNGKFIAIMHMHSEKDLPKKKTDVFLNGIHFPEIK